MSLIGRPPLFLPLALPRRYVVRSLSLTFPVRQIVFRAACFIFKHFPFVFILNKNAVRLYLNVEEVKSELGACCGSSSSFLGSTRRRPHSLRRGSGRVSRSGSAWCWLLQRTAKHVATLPLLRYLYIRQLIPCLRLPRSRSRSLTAVTSRVRLFCAIHALARTGQCRRKRLVSARSLCVAV